MDDLLNHLDFWLMIFTFGAAAYFLLWKDRIQPIVRALFPPREPQTEARSARPARRPARLKLRPRPVRGARGQFNGSVPAVPAQERRSEERSASESPVSGDNEVPIVPVSVPEIVAITMRLAQGMAPSDVAKSLPGYSARNYQAYMAKVRQVKATMEEQGQGSEGARMAEVEVAR